MCTSVQMGVVYKLIAAMPDAWHEHTKNIQVFVQDVKTDPFSGLCSLD